LVEILWDSLQFGALQKLEKKQKKLQKSRKWYKLLWNTNRNSYSDLSSDAISNNLERTLKVIAGTMNVFSVHTSKNTVDTKLITAIGSRT